MSASEQTVQYALANRTATVTVNRPGQRNALGPDEWRQLEAAFARAARDPEVRVVVVTGAGNAFSAGGDVKTMPARLALEPAARRQQILDDSRAIRALWEIDKPVVARIDGPCVGAGLSLALACDLRIASRRSTFGAVFHRIGLTGDFGMFYLLPRAVGASRAMEMMMLADMVDAARAETIGLVHRVCEGEALDAEVDEIARRLAEGPAVAQALTKAGLRASLERYLATTLEWEAGAQAIASRTDDAREGLAALAEKRPPRFSGR